jgi:hypothetical protein
MQLWTKIKKKSSIIDKRRQVLYTAINNVSDARHI